jgi:two-component system, cell cycle response regulator
MSNLVRTAYIFRQTLTLSAPSLLLGGFIAALCLEASKPLPDLYVALVGLCLLAFLFMRYQARSQVRGYLRAVLTEVEILVGVLVLCTGFLLAMGMDLAGPGFALTYIVVALAAAWARRLSTTIAVVSLGLIESVLWKYGFGKAIPNSMFVHVGIAGVFAFLNSFIMQGELVRLRKHSRAHVDAELDKIRDAARSYRLIGAPSSMTTAPPPSVNTAKTEERLVRSSIEEIHQAVLFSLDLVRRSLELRTAMLLWLNASGTHLRISELSTDIDGVLEGPFLAGDSVFGAALARKAPVSLNNLKANYKLPYYDGACPVGSICAVPVLEQGEIRGLLIVDRDETRGFSAREEEQLMAATRHCLRAIQNERVFIQLERAKAEQGKLYRAAEALGGARGEVEVLEAAVTSAREIASFDFAAVTLFDPVLQQHEIRAISGDGADHLLGARFRHNQGLVGMVIKNQHPLPYRGEMSEATQVVFSQRLAMPPVASVLVLPLIEHKQPMGTLILGARRRGAFGDAVRPTLEVLATHLAVSLSNARMLKKLEEMATTDGMTGLLNKRALLDMADQKLAAASRFGRRVSVVVTDIDFFKKVNDTYGHDVGDVVIKGLGTILKRIKRTTDAVARFGGEEFVIICEETDSKGAMQLAERIREELEKTEFQSPKGSFNVTCSLGVATFPMAGKDWETLFKSADEALYQSKHNGRNRSTAWAPPKRSNAALFLEQRLSGIDHPTKSCLSSKRCWTSFATALHHVDFSFDHIV